MTCNPTPLISTPDPLLDLEQRLLAADRAWMTANRALVAAHDACGPIPVALRAADDDARRLVQALSAEMAAAPVTTLAGLAVKARRLFESDVLGRRGDEGEVLRTMFAFLTGTLRTDQLGALRDGTLEEFARRQGAGPG